MNALEKIVSGKVKPRQEGESLTTRETARQFFDRRLAGEPKDDGPGWLYHATTADRLPSIRRHGLQSRDHPVVDGGSQTQRETHYATDLKSALQWGSNRYAYHSDLPREGKEPYAPAILRVREHHVKGLEGRKERGGAGNEIEHRSHAWTLHPVAPEHLEHWHAPSQSWRPLKRALAKMEAGVDGLELTAQDVEGGRKARKKPGSGGLLTVGELLRRSGVDPICDGCGRASKKCICERDGKGLQKAGDIKKPPCGKCGRTDYNDIRGRLCDRCAFPVSKASKRSLTGRGPFHVDPEKAGTNAEWERAHGGPMPAHDEPGYLYHATTDDRLSRIQRHGLRPGEAATFKEASSPHHVSLAPTAEHAKYWSGMTFWRRYDDTRHPVARTAAPRPIILRVKHEHVEKPEAFRPDEVRTKHPVAPQHLEYYHSKEAVWKPLAAQGVLRKALDLLAKTKDARGVGSDKHSVKNPYTDPEQDQRSRNNPFGDEHALDGNLPGQVAQQHQHAEEVKDAVQQAGGSPEKLIADAVFPAVRHPHHRKAIEALAKAACENLHFPPSSAFKVAKQPEREEHGSEETRSRNASVTRSGTTGHIRIAQSHKLSAEQCRGYVHHLSRIFGVDAPVVRVKRGVGHNIRAYHTVGKTPSTSTIDVSDGTLPLEGPKRVPRGNDYCTLTHEFAHHLFHARNPWLKHAVDDPHGPEFRRTFTEVASAAHRHARKHERGAIAKVALAEDTEYLTDIDPKECRVRYGRRRVRKAADLFREGGAFNGAFNRANGVFAKPAKPQVDGLNNPSTPPKTHVGPNPVGNYHLSAMRNANALMSHVKNAADGPWLSRRAGMMEAANGAHVATHAGLKNVNTPALPPPKLKALDEHPLRDIAAHADLMHQHAYAAFHAHQEGNLGRAASAWTLAHAHAKYLQGAVGRLGSTAPTAASPKPKPMKTGSAEKPPAKAEGDLPDVITPQQALDLLGDRKKMPKGVKLKAADAIMHSSGRAVHNLLAKRFEAVCEGAGGEHPCHESVVGEAGGKFLCRTHLQQIRKDWRERQAALADDMKRRARRDFQRVLPEGKVHEPNGPRSETVVAHYPGPRGQHGLPVDHGDHVTEHEAGTHAAVRTALDTIHEQRKKYGLPKLGFFSHGKFTDASGDGAGAVCWAHHPSQDKRYQNGGIHVDENLTHDSHRPHPRPLTTEEDPNPQRGMPDSNRRWWWSIAHGEKGRKAKARTTAIHEFGHHVDHVLGAVDGPIKSNGLRYPYGHSGTYNAHGSWEERLNHAHGEALFGHKERGPRNMLDQPAGVSQDWSDRDVGSDGAHHGQCRLPSDYCHANPHEHFAEAWAAEHTGRGDSVHPAMRAMVHEAQGRLADMSLNATRARNNARFRAEHGIGKALDILEGKGHHGQRAGKAQRRAMDKPQSPTCAGMVPGGGISEEERIERDLSHKPRTGGKCQAETVQGARSFYTPLPCGEQATHVVSKRVAGKWRKWRVCEAHADDLSSSHGFDADSIRPDLRKAGDLDALIAKGRRGEDTACSDESCAKDATLLVGQRLLCDGHAREAMK